MPRIVFFILIFLFTLQLVSAQTGRQYSFRHFSVTNGLAANTVGSIAQDAEGFIWMATTNGLQRYDGNTFLTFRANAKDSTAVPSTHLYNLYVDRGKRLWLVSDKQRIGIFDTKKFTFREAQIAGRKKIAPDFLLQELPDGNMIVKLEGKVYLYDAALNRFILNNQLFPLPRNWHFAEMVWDEKLKIFWIGADSGLLHYNPVTKRMNYRGHNPDNDPVINAFAQQRGQVGLRVDAKGNVIYSFWPPNSGNGFLYRYNRKTAAAEKINLGFYTGGYHELTGYLQQKNGRFWVYGMPFLYEWTDSKTDPFVPVTGINPESPDINFDIAYKVIEDREQNIWLACDNGVYVFNPDAQIFSTYHLQRTDEKKARELPVQAVTELADGRIVVGCWGSGIFLFDQKLNPLPLPPALRARGKNLSVWDMNVHSRSGHLWIAQQGGYLSVYNPQQDKLTDLQPEVFGASTIRQLDEDTSGNFWFGTQSGKLIKWDMKAAGNDPSKGYTVMAQMKRIIKVHFDYAGFVWLGTVGGGLVKFDTRTNKVVKTFTTNSPVGEKMFTDYVTDMTYYNDTTLIVTADCIHIVNPKTGKIKLVTADDGLPSNTAISVEKDESGIIWVGMNHGLCRINLKKNVIGYYDRRNGIAYDKFSTTSVQELKDGRIVFYTDHNFLVFDPKKFVQEIKPPNPQITTLQLSSERILFDSIKQHGGAVELNYKSSSITIGFSALSYLLQASVYYYYRMEGVDKTWIRTDKPFEAAYNYLPPGKFVFKVKTVNADGVESDDTASIAINVQPPFYKAWWFWGVVVLLALAILYAINKEREKRKKTLRKMRRNIAGNLHSEIQAGLNNINVLSEIARIKADKNVEQSKEFIDQISYKSRNMVEAMDDMLWSIDPRNDSMKKTVLRIGEFTDSLRASTEVEIDLIVDHKVQKLEMDMRFRHELFFFYKEAMQFLLQNTHSQQLFVNINQVRSKLMMEILVECTGAGNTLATRFKKALKKRAEAISAQVDVVVEEKSFSVIMFVNIK